MNNPFGKQPQSVVEQTAQRFPAVDGAPEYYSAPIQPQMTGYQPQQQQPMYAQMTGYQQQQPYSQHPMYAQQTGYGQPAAQQFGQPHFGGGGGGPQQYGQHQYAYGQQQQQQQQQAYPNTTDLDPYASLGALTPSRGSTASSSLLQVPQSQSHPRQYVQENKHGLMNWDEYSWKQLFSRVDALREAWEQRVAGIKAAANQGADPTSVEQLRREAESHVDSIHAAKMQMNEVKSGWKHSTDPASKARVREALNAGLSAMPEYPQPIAPEQLGGSFYREAAQQHQKSTIMSQYGAAPGQQQQSYSFASAGLHPQATGYGGYAGHGAGMLGAQQTGYTGYQGYMQQPPYYG